MKTNRCQLLLTSFYSRTELEKHFSKMAQKGWLIERISGLSCVYRRIEPASLKFNVCYFSDVSKRDPTPSENQQAFYDLCAHTGWNLACTYYQMQVFYNDRPDPVPIETDPVTEVEAQHNRYKKSILPSAFLSILIVLLMGTGYAVRLLINPIGVLAQPGNVSISLLWLCATITSLVEIPLYYLWLFKARKAAQRGVFMDIPSSKVLFICFWVILLTCAAVALVELLITNPFDAFFTIFTLIGVVGILFFLKFLQEEFKKLKVTKNFNHLLTLSACCTLVFILVVIALLLSIGLTSAGYIDTDHDDPPLYIWELTGADRDDCRKDDDFSESLLLAEHKVTQKVKSGGPKIEYTVVTVKAPFLYNRCKKQLQGEYDMQQDSALWAAKEAYRLYDGEDHWTYLLCYDGQIVKLQFSWEPTDAQIEIAGQQLAP